jgi:hypothetical protein
MLFRPESPDEFAARLPQLAAMWDAEDRNWIGRGGGHSE